ncbi:sensor histidine kinase [Parachryseolinea silvisoli]|uniref:sensor histidine kinase n=1 Tax=Parachryseolinea silvisoli TaxID=2873601 RepID=UPI002265DDC4|nr:CHASE3 domain-containing protein [Parachryseolinea silvisoli]MCD9018878.1 CHASE3 domain-containing protein [Parachryseolinea silvisoli]
MKDNQKKVISVTAALITMLIGLSVIIGWMTHNDFLKYLIIIPGAVKMKFNIALGFLFSSVVLLLHHFPGKTKVSIRISRGLCSIIFLIGFLTIAEYVLGVNIGMDELFVRDDQSTTATYYAGRMSPISAINFMLISVGLLTLKKEKTASYQFIYLSFIAFISIVTLIGINFISDIPTAIRLAVHVSIGFFILSVAIYYAQPELHHKIRFEQKLIAGFVASISLLTVISVLSIFYIGRLTDTTKSVEHARNVLSEAEQTLSFVKDIESGGRGYLITQDSSYLEHFMLARSNIHTNIRKLKELTQGRASLETILDSLSVYIDKRIAFTAKLITTRNENGFEAAQRLVLTKNGNRITDKIRHLITSIQRDETNLLTQRQKENAKSSRDFNNAFGILLVSMVALLTIVFFTVWINFSARTRAEKELMQVNRELEKNINQVKESKEKFSRIFDVNPVGISISRLPAGTMIDVNASLLKMYGFTLEEVVGRTAVELNMVDSDVREELIRELMQGVKVRDREILVRHKSGTMFPVLFSVDTFSMADKQFVITFSYDITDRKKAEERVIQLNTDLEANLQQLEMANKEMESFTYSVSHDLRTPLRAIDGYARMLDEDFSTVLDNEGRRLLDTIQYNAKKMGNLIDDLLAFSRLGKKGLQKTTVNTRELVENVLYEIGNSLSDNASVKIGNLQPIEADYALINQVFVNLLSNAAKYSSKKECPIIEIESKLHETEVIYSVKDNGAGFDMKYADMLFGVFQRLHKVNEFDGTGVGLAIAHRIVSKHGGRIWADAKPGEGATFFFSLPI